MEAHSFSVRLDTNVDAVGQIEMAAALSSIKAMAILFVYILVYLVPYIPSSFHLAHSHPGLVI